MGVKVREKTKGSGEWWIFINHDGKRKAKRIGRDKKAALAIAKKLEAKLASGDILIEDHEDEQKNSVFEEYAGIWISVTVPATCKPSSISDYKGILNNHVLPEFGKKPVNEITRMMVRNFLMKKQIRGLLRVPSPTLIMQYQEF